jgi:hypothetical protein
MLVIVQCERARVIVGKTALDDDDSGQDLKKQAEQ